MSQVYAIKYDLATGEFAGQNRVSEDMLDAQAGPGQGVVGSVRNVIVSTPGEPGEAPTITYDFSGVVDWLAPDDGPVRDAVMAASPNLAAMAAAGE